MCHLQELHIQYRDKGLVILGVNVDDNREIVLDMLRENGATFPNILDTSEAAQKVVFDDYRGGAVPQSCLIDRDGNIVDVWVGYNEEQGHARVKALLKDLGIE